MNSSSVVYYYCRRLIRCQPGTANRFRSVLFKKEDTLNTRRSTQYSRSADRPGAQPRDNSAARPATDPSSANRSDAGPSSSGMTCSQICHLVIQLTRVRSK